MVVQWGYMLFRGLYAVQKGSMMKKIMMILVATNIVASRPPERRPTGTPTARANYDFFWTPST